LFPRFSEEKIIKYHFHYTIPLELEDISTHHYFKFAWLLSNPHITARILEPEDLNISVSGREHLGSTRSNPPLTIGDHPIFPYTWKALCGRNPLHPRIHHFFSVFFRKIESVHSCRVSQNKPTSVFFSDSLSIIDLDHPINIALCWIQTRRNLS